MEIAKLYENGEIAQHFITQLQIFVKNVPDYGEHLSEYLHNTITIQKRRR